MLKCKKCGGDIKIIRRSCIVPSIMWVQCKCTGAISFYIPEYIPNEQVEKYLYAKM